MTAMRSRPEPARRPRTVGALLSIIALAVASCGTSATLPPSPAASSVPTVPSTPTSPSPSPPPEASPSPTPCPELPAALPAPGPRLVGVFLEEREELATTADIVIFDFEADEDAPDVPRAGRLETVVPPLVQDPSGLPLEVAGDRFLRVRFEGLLLYGDLGRPVRQTSEPIVGGPPAVVEVARESEFEGVSSWIIGIEAGGCVTTWTLEDELDVVVAVQR
jgi:hypothetical protein